MSGQEAKEPAAELTPEEIRRLVEEAKAQGKPTEPLIRRFVLETIDAVIARLEAEESEEAED